jgi:hypothetical protein
VLGHVELAREEIAEFLTDKVGAEGLLKRPQSQVALLKVAREELDKAIALMESTKWDE